MGKRIYQKIKRLFECLLEVLLPEPLYCCGCGRDCHKDSGHVVEIGLCKDCERLLQRFLGGLEQDRIRPCFDRYIIGYNYEGLTRDMVHALKYQGEKRMAITMGRLLATCIVKDLKHHQRQRHGYDLVVPVPLSEQKQNSRGYNHAQLIAQELADVIGARLSDCLTRTKDTRPQVLFNSSQRWYNVKGCFHCTRDLTGLSVLLVDDVVTTGATAHYCAEAMKACGAVRITVLAFAKSNSK